MKTFKVTYGITLYADIYVKAEDAQEARARLEANGTRFVSDNFGGTYNVDLETNENPEYDYDMDFNDDDPDYEITDVQVFDGERKFL